MRTPVLALAWEFWGANRRGWLIVLAALGGCGLLLRALPQPLKDTEGVRFICYFPLVASIILAISFCNFTDRNRHDGIAGFPRHLFALPARTSLLVTCAMVLSVLSVVAIYVAWAKLVLEPLDVSILICWPATLLAAFVVFYQAMIWCLCGFRLTRVIGLSLVATILVAVGFLPTLLPKTDFWASEANLSATLGALMAIAYGVTIGTVGLQRRGGGRGWTGIQTLMESLTRAIPQRHITLRSPDAAIFWMEWRRAGLVLPAAVLLTTLLILGPVLSFTGRGEKETLWAETWLVILPIMLAFPIGMGFGKPDFWSLDLKLSPFLATRPITAGQLVAAKLKAAACSALLAWSLVLMVSATVIYLFCDTTHWDHARETLAILYSPFSQWALPVMTLAGAVFLTWSLLVSSIWLGYSGRAGFYYTLTAIGLAAFVTGFFLLVWWLDHPRGRGSTLVGMLPWLPWALAALATTRIWIATLCTPRLVRRRLVTRRNVAKYACVWLMATVCLLYGGWLMSPRIEWFRNTIMLLGLCTIPALTIVVAPLAIAWNRHR
jgi:hypothetical protein